MQAHGGFVCVNNAVVTEHLFCKLLDWIQCRYVGDHTMPPGIGRAWPVRHHRQRYPHGSSHFELQQEHMDGHALGG